MRCYAIFLIFLGISSLLVSCDNATGGEDNGISVKPAQNITVDHSNITLFYNNESSISGFALTFQNVKKLTCADVNITTTHAYNMVPKESIFKPYVSSCTKDCGEMWQYGCIKSNDNIILTGAPPRMYDGFRPLADQFNINLGETTFYVTVDTLITPSQLLSRGTQTQMNLNSGFTGCGLFGTVVQRAFDCSKKIINYSVYVDPVSAFNQSAIPNLNGTSTFYTLFSPALLESYPAYADAYWFVVSCPNSDGSGSIPQQNCAWLSPIVPENNPAVEKPGLYQTFAYDMLVGYQKRLLFSGKMDNFAGGFSFEDANGFLMTSAQVYNFLGIGTYTPPPMQVSPSVCMATAGDTLYSGSMLPLQDLFVRDLISFDSGSMVTWQMPSYPMLNITTGGSPTDLSSKGYCMTGNPWVALWCDAINLSNLYYMQAFNAINVPGFSMTDTAPPSTSVNYPEILWSSSASNFGDFLGGFGLVVNFNGDAAYTSIAPDSIFAGVRCTSLSWY